MRTQQHLSPIELASIEWRISRLSTDTGDCVEVGPLSDGSGRVAVRHSHHREGSILVFTKTEWAAFIGGVREGEFDFDFA
jgi:hypothetical protein